MRNERLQHIERVRANEDRLSFREQLAAGRPQFKAAETNRGIQSEILTAATSTAANLAYVDAFGKQRRTAVNIPRRISIGAGGQPGTATSTGITFDTRPRHA